MSSPAAHDGHGSRMSMLQHFTVLRRCLMRLCLGVILGTSVGVLIAPMVLEYIGQPYLQLSQDSLFLVIDPTGAVVAYFRVALLVGLSFSIPNSMYQVITFIWPGMSTREQRWLMASLPAMFMLFLVGVGFAWFILIPPALHFLANFHTDLFQSAWEAGRYIRFVTALLFWMGVAFQMPLVLFVLALLHLVQARTLIRGWRVAVVLTAVAAAAITPTVDPINMLLVMAPLIGLYAISVGLVALASRLTPTHDDHDHESETI